MKKVIFNDIEKSLTQWAEETGLPRHIISSRIYKLGWSVNDALTVAPYLTRGKKRKIQFSEKDVSDIVFRYKENHESPYKIAPDYKSSVSLIYKLLKNNNIITDIWNRKYFFNEDYFSEIDTPRKAYWLGLFYADAGIKDNVFSLGFKREDRYMLEILANDVGYTGDIKDLSEIRSLRGRQSKEYLSSKMRLCGKKFCSHLQDNGLIANKTFRLSYPKSISNELHKHFIRGLFDGDGYVSLNKKGSFVWGVVGQKKLLELVADVLLKETGIRTNKIYKTSPNCWNMGFSCAISSNGSRANDMLKLKQWLYTDADVFFKRKKLKFDKIGVK